MLRLLVLPALLATAGHRTADAAKRYGHLESLSMRAEQLRQVSENVEYVTFQIDTRVLAGMPREKAHELGVYRIEGSRITFEGALFEDVGDHPPRRSLTEFSVSGDDVSFKNCRFVIRGSAPYGYGDLYGKGRGAAVWLQKHSGVGISGDRCLIEDCEFQILSFGHGIHMHGAQDTVIRNVTMVGELRRAAASPSRWPPAPKSRIAG